MRRVVVGVFVCALLASAVVASAAAPGDASGETVSGTTVGDTALLGENGSTDGNGGSTTGNHSSSTTAERSKTNEQLASLELFGRLTSAARANDSFSDAVPASAFHNRSSLAPNGSSRTPAPGNGSAVLVYNGSATERLTARADENDTNATGGTQRSTLPRAENGTVRIGRPLANDGTIGADDRERITREDGLTSYPWSPVVELRVITQDGRRVTCSGTIITEENASESSYHVLTAGHCVYFPDRGGWIDTEPPSVDGTPQSRVVPAANGDERPFGTVGIRRIRSYEGWTRFQHQGYDVALLTLERRIGNRTGTLGYASAEDGSEVYSHAPTTVVGYPADKPSHTMWTDTGAGLGTLGDGYGGGVSVHTYNADIFGGMSGGPVWISAYPEFTGRRIVSVNAVSLDSNRDGETDFNAGTRITSERFDDLQRWMSADDRRVPEDAGNDRFEPNDAFASATPINGGTHLDGLHVVDGEPDVYAIDLAAGERLTAEIPFDHATGDLDLGVFGPDRQLLRSSESRTDGEQVTVDGVSDDGRYYVVVAGYEGASAPYALSVQVDQPSESSVQVREHRTCTDVQETQPYECPSGTVTETFQPTDRRAVSWADFGTVSRTFDLTWHFYDPSGDLYETVEAVGNPDGGETSDYHHWAWIDIAGTEAARTPGEWTVEISVEGARISTDTFTIASTDDDRTGVDLSNADALVNSRGAAGSDLFWWGQALGVQDASRANTDLQLRIETHENQDSTLPVGEVSLDSDGEGLVRTGAIPRSDVPGDFAIAVDSNTFLTVDDGRITGTTSDVDEAEFEIAPQTLTFEFTPRSLSPGGDTTVEIRSDRGRYEATVTAANADDGTLLAFFGQADRFNATDVDVDGDGVIDDGDGIEITVDSTDLERVLSTAPLDPGRQYSFSLEVTDTVDTGATGELTVQSQNPRTTELSVTPERQRVTAGSSVAYDVVVENVTGGVGSYDLTVAVAAPSRATIAGASNEIGGTARTEPAANGSSIQLGAFGGDTNDNGTDVVIATVTLTGQRAGTTGVTVVPRAISDEQGGDLYTVTGVNNATLAVDEQPSGDAVSVGLEPVEGSVRPDGTTTFGIVAEGATSGVGGYELTINSSDTSVAVVTDGTTAIGGTGRVSVADGGSGARFGAFGGDTADSGAVTIGSVTVRGMTTGTVELPLSIASVSDEAGNQYPIGTQSGATLTVETSRAPDVGDTGVPATDPDGDGLYEDVNGDGDVTPGDATVLFNAVFGGDPAVTENVSLFDFNRDRQVAPGDATVLFNEVF